MTSYKDPESLRCAVCGAESRQEMPASADSRGTPDLDTRPAGMARSTILSWVLQCPQCRYAAPDIREEAPAGVPELVRTEHYQAIECRFERHAWILAQLGHYADAGWVSLHAAWIADDEGDAGRAREWRGRAVERWKKGKQHGQSFMQATEQEFALVVDLLRRRGDFAEAKETCLAGLDEEGLSPAIEDMLRFQLALIGRRDAAAHSTAELPKRPEGGERVTLT